MSDELNLSVPTLLEQAQAKLAASLAALPEGKNAAVALVATTDGVRAAYLRRAQFGSTSWQFEGFIGKKVEEDAGLEAGAAVLVSWR